MNTLIRNIGHIIKKYISLEHCVIRFVMTWCFVSLLQLLQLLKSGHKQLDELENLKLISFPTMLVSIVVLFFLFYCSMEILSHYHKKVALFVEAILLFIVTLIYGIVCVVNHADLYYCIGITALLGFSVCYGVGKIQASCLHLPERVQRIGFPVCMVILGILFVAFTGGCTIVRYLSFGSPNFDFGIFSQMFHSMKTNFTMNTTCERDHLMSHFAVHISPAYYLILPAYALFSSPVTLQFMQAVVIAAGLIPLTGICRNHGLNRIETILIGIAYTAYPVMSAGCFYDIHENMFLPLFLLMFFYFCEKDQWKGTIISMLLVFSVKEDASIYIAFIALYLILGLKQYRKGIMILCCAVIYFCFTTLLMSQIGAGVMSIRFNNMILEKDGNMLSIIKTVIMHPAYFMTQIFQEEKLKFVLQVLGPLLFLPLFTKKWYRFILLGPFVLFNLMSNDTYFHNIYFQYVFGSGSILLYLTILNVSDMQEKTRTRLIPMVAVSSVMFFSSIMWKETKRITNYNKPENQKIYEVMREGIDQIPENASVIATTFLCPALSDRDVLYELYYTDKEAEYIALDLRYDTDEYDENTYLNDSQYETVYYAPGIIGIFHKK